MAITTNQNYYAFSEKECDLYEKALKYKEEITNNTIRTY